MPIGLTGFVVRRASPGEVPELLRPAGASPIAFGDFIVYGAFGQPGDLPLGAMIVKPVGKESAHFQIFVRPEFRRKGIGTRLIENLTADARRHRTPDLRLVGLVHQDDPANAFYRKMGLTPETSLATYTLSIAKGLLLCSRIAARFRRKLDRAGAKIVTLDQLSNEKVARFFADNYNGVFDHRLEQLHAGSYDRAISTAIIDNQDQVLAAGLFRSQPGNPAIYLDLVLVRREHRNGPMPLVLFEQTGRLSLDRGFKDCVFEGDANHDPFATGFAVRCGCKPQWFRYRYAMRVTLEQGAQGP